MRGRNGAARREVRQGKEIWTLHTPLDTLTMGLSRGIRVMRRGAAGLLALLMCSSPAVGAGFGFGPPVTIGEVSTAHTVAADVDDDGRTDIVMLAGGPSAALDRKLVIYYQGPGGTYGAPAVHDFGWQEFALNGPYLAVADMDGDSDLDVIVATGDDGGRISILRNDGTSFDSTSVGEVGELSDVDVEDVNGDGNPDVVALYAFFDAVAIFYGDGNGGFAGSAYLELPTGTADLHMVDIDGDGRRDLVYGTKDYVYMHRHEGQWFAPIPRKLFAINVDLYAPDVAFGDVNGDGRTDVLVDGMLSWPVLLTIHEQDAQGRFVGRKAPVWTSDRGGVSLPDVDNDGFVDLLVLRYGLDGAVAAIHFGNGRGKFGAEQLHIQPGETIMAADLNSDGLVDLLARRDEDLVVYPGALSVAGDDVTVRLDLQTNVARLRVVNLGDVPSQASSLYFKLDARAGEIVAGAIPSGCWADSFDGRLSVECQIPALAVGDQQEIVLPYAVSSGLRTRVHGRAELYTPIPDTRPGNNAQSKWVIVPAAQPAKAPRAGTPRRNP